MGTIPLETEFLRLAFYPPQFIKSLCYPSYCCKMSVAPSDAELMSRLQSQFGDLDLTQLLENGEIAPGDSGADANSEESSLAEPSPEELRAWQESQFQKGQEAIEERKTNELKGAVQRRRAKLRKQYAADDEDDWEQVAALPRLQGQSSAFFPSSDAHRNEILGVHPLLQQLAEGDAEILGTPWRRLYSSSEGDGLSYFNLLETLRGYPGPTVLLIGAVPSATKSTLSSSHRSPLAKTNIGFYTASPWIESTCFTGTAECFLFAMDEEKVHFFKPRALKPTQKEPHYMYCHPSTLNVTNRRIGNTGQTDGLVHGLGVGGTPAQPRLHLTETLENCRAMEYCTLFEGGDLLLGFGKDSLNYFDVDCVEVWAVGGEEWIEDSMKTQERQRAISEAAIRKAHKVDKNELFRDLHLLNPRNSGFFAHVQHATDRCDV